MTPAMQKALDLHQPGERKQAEAYVGFEPVDANAARLNRIRGSLTDDDWPKKIRAFRELYGLIKFNVELGHPLSQLRYMLHRGLFAEETAETLFPGDDEHSIALRKQYIHQARDTADQYVLDHEELIAEVVDGVLDSIVVGLGWLDELGLMPREINALLAEVHASNMTKVDDNGQPVYDTNGKVTKGSNYVKADVIGLLRQFIADRTKGAN